MSILAKIILSFFAFAALFGCASAHDEPTSFIDFRLSSSGIEIVLTGSITDFAHELPKVEPDSLLKPDTIQLYKEDINVWIASRLRIIVDGAPLTLVPGEITPKEEKRDLRAVLTHSWKSAPVSLRVEGLLFPYDPRHRTFLNVYAGDEILRQEIFTAATPSVEFQTGKHQNLSEVVIEFIHQGIHHIFIGPDHILFVIGLMLRGGNLKQRFGIITAFTLAHSITLGSATFYFISPPASLVEPVIALSIVFVGIHSLFSKGGRDLRLIFAFCFGLIHGFGFASVLQQMVLPQQALGWALFSFNVGVEIGQGCIVITLVLLLALLRRSNARMADGFVGLGGLGITAAGAFWFFQRVMG
jgi:hydrogenase/urease accessory protein HupE